MSQAKHTPGPWEWDGRVWQYDEQEEAPWLVQAPWHDIKSKTVLSGSIRCNTKADARLIAAAPELLEALIWMVANDETNEGDEPVESLDGESWNDCNKYWIDGLNRARAAIAKATGGTS